MRQTKQKVISTGVIIIFAVVMLVYALSYSNLTAKLLPLIACGLLISLGSIEIVRDLRKGRESDRDSDKEAASEPTSPFAPQGELRKYIIGFIWLVGLALTIFLVGSIISTPIFILAFLKANKRSWRASLVTAIVTGGILYALFDVILQAQLFEGVLFGAMP